MTPNDLVLTPFGIRFQGQIYPCTLGQGGLSHHKREGDGATPRGTHAITGMYYRPDRLARPAPWALAIRPGDLWSDAPIDPAYNTAVRAPYGHSHETLRRADRLYDIILITDWNTPAKPHLGSAIFLHRWRKPGHPTEGCIAFRPADLRRIAKKISRRSRLIIP